MITDGVYKILNVTSAADFREGGRKFVNVIFKLSPVSFIDNFGRGEWQSNLDIHFNGSVVQAQFTEGSNIFRVIKELNKTKSIVLLLVSVTQVGESGKIISAAELRRKP